MCVQRLGTRCGPESCGDSGQAGLYASNGTSDRGQRELQASARHHEVKEGHELKVTAESEEMVRGSRSDSRKAVCCPSISTRQASEFRIPRPKFDLDLSFQMTPPSAAALLSQKIHSPMRVTQLGGARLTFAVTSPAAKSQHRSPSVRARDSKPSVPPRFSGLQRC